MRSRGKLYLNGSDWMIQALHHSTWKTAGTGNSSQVVMELEGVLPEDELRRCLGALAPELPMLTGRAARNPLNLAPYWKYSRSARTEIELTVQVLPADSSPDHYLELLATGVNTPFPRTGTYVRFSLIHWGGKSALAMNFDHRLFDAHGAELFLHALVELAADRVTPAAVADVVTWSAPSLLNHWRDRFLAGRTVVRRLLALTPEGTFTPAAPAARTPTEYRLFTLSAEETVQFRRNAEHLTVPMLVPYGLHLAFKSFRRLQGAALAAGERCIASCNVDLRSPDAGWEEMLFNYVSFLLFEETDAMAAAGGPSLPELCGQFYDQMKLDFPRCLAKAWVLMRILPIPIYSWAILRNMKRCFGAFNFSFLKDCAVQGDSLLGCRITNIFHMPRIPHLTGAGFYFSQYGGRLNICLATHRGMHAPDRLAAAEESIRTALRI